MAEKIKIPDNPDKDFPVYFEYVYALRLHEHFNFVLCPSDEDKSEIMFVDENFKEKQITFDLQDKILRMVKKRRNAYFKRKGSTWLIMNSKNKYLKDAISLYLKSIDNP